MLRALTASIFALTLAMPAAALDLDAMSESERAAFGDAVRDYLMENPQVIMEAVQLLEQRQADAQAEADKSLVAGQRRGDLRGRLFLCGRQPGRRHHAGGIPRLPLRILQTGASRSGQAPGVRRQYPADREGIPDPGRPVRTGLPLCHCHAAGGRGCGLQVPLRHADGVFRGQGADRRGGSAGPSSRSCPAAARRSRRCGPHGCRRRAAGRSARRLADAHQPHPALPRGRLHGHRLDQPGIGVQLGVGDPVLGHRRRARPVRSASPPAPRGPPAPRACRNRAARVPRRSTRP
jgi:hypothetical protein